MERSDEGRTFNMKVFYVCIYYEHLLCVLKARSQTRIDNCIMYIIRLPPLKYFVYIV